MAHPTTKASLSPQLAATNILDWLKPSRGEAIARLRTNSLGLLTIAILTHLLPLPSPWTAVATIRGHAPVNTLYYGFCALGTRVSSGYVSSTHIHPIEVLALSLLAVNILQASYALKYPRTQTPTPAPLPSPAKTNPASPRKWHLNNVTPTVCFLLLSNCSQR